MLLQSLHMRLKPPLQPAIRCDAERTRMGMPVLVTGEPRERPSVCSMEMVRTVLSPKCCATSSTSRTSKPGTSSAVVMGGSSPSNRTSTTAPITCGECKHRSSDEVQREVHFVLR